MTYQQKSTEALDQCLKHTKHQFATSTMNTPAEALVGDLVMPAHDMSHRTRDWKLKHPDSRSKKDHTRRAHNHAPAPPVTTGVQSGSRPVHAPRVYLEHDVQESSQQTPQPAKNTLAIQVAYAAFFAMLMGLVGFCSGNFWGLYTRDDHDYFVLTNPSTRLGTGMGILAGALLGVIHGLVMTRTQWGKSHYNLWIALRDMIIVTIVMVGLGLTIGHLVEDSHELGYFLGCGGLCAFLASLLVLYLRYKSVPKTLCRPGGLLENPEFTSVY